MNERDQQTRKLGKKFGLPAKQGLYDPAYEKDSCGVGFVCNIKGIPSRKIMDDAAAMNCCMDHRGGVGFEKNSGDGAGIMTGLPDKFLRKECQQLFNVQLPDHGEYGIGNVFLPNDAIERQICKNLLEEEIVANGLQLIGWREVPVDTESADIGKTAMSAMPRIEQLFVKSKARIDSESRSNAVFSPEACHPQNPS